MMGTQTTKCDFALYNYCPESITERTLFSYINNLFDYLKEVGINTKSFSLHDAKEEFPESYILLNNVIEYFNKGSDKLPTYLIHSAICFLRDCLNSSPNLSNSNWCYFPGTVEAETRHHLIKLLNSELKSSQEFLPCFTKSIVITGKQYNLEEPWGVEMDGNNVALCIIGHINEKLIWHETAHLLGAKDHYDSDNHDSNDLCENPSNCLMQWANLEGSFCSASIKEMKIHCD